MHMHIYQTCRYYHTRGIDHLRLWITNAISNHGYSPIVDQNIHNSTDPTDGINHSAMFYQ